MKTLIDAFPSALSYRRDYADSDEEDEPAPEMLTRVATKPAGTYCTAQCQQLISWSTPKDL